MQISITREWGNLESQKEFLRKIGSNCILKERRLNFSTEGTFRPVFEAAPYRSWWCLLEKVRTCLQQLTPKI
jgi:hypothetical protein